jgi:hypothetical protein
MSAIATACEPVQRDPAYLGLGWLLALGPRHLEEALVRLGSLLGVVAASGAVLAAGTARAQVALRAEPDARPGRRPSGLEVGLRTGYALPMGALPVSLNAGSSSSLSGTFDGVVPIEIDAGYRISPRWYVGAFFQYGFGFINYAPSPPCKVSGASCSGTDLQFGLDIQHHFLPAGTFDPWIGLGASWESVSTSLGDGVHESLSGFQFLNLQLGGDFHHSFDDSIGDGQGPTSSVGGGPFVMLSVGELPNGWESNGMGTSPFNAVHQWLTFGVRGYFDIERL